MNTAKPRLFLISFLLGALAIGAPQSSVSALSPEPARATSSAKPQITAAEAGPRAAPGVPRMVLESADFTATLSAQNGALQSFLLKDPRFRRDGKPIELVTTDKPAYLPLRTTFGSLNVPADAVWKVEQLSPQAARFTLQVGDVFLIRKVEVGAGPYQLWSTLRVVNQGSAARSLDVAVEGHHYVRRDEEQGGFLAGRSPLMASGLCVQDDTPKRFERADMVEDKPHEEGAISFGSVDTVYFTQALAAHGTSFTRCELAGSDRGGSKDEPEGALLSVTLRYPTAKLPAGGQAVFRTLAFVGPKLPDALAAAGHNLPQASYVGGLPGVDFIARGLLALLAFIHDKGVANWGVAIILLTLLVKLVLYPLTAKSFQSMAGMRRLKPEIDALNERFKDDREKKGAAMMELYRKHKINPFGGCLPQLLQLPIWWALYMSLSSNVELFRRPFFGHWQDLTAPDPFYVLPLALGVLMWVQQKITPSTMDPAQAKMMLYMMPAMITSFMLFLPAGLCLYMFTNSVLSIAQQRFIEYRIANKQPPTGGGASGLSGSPSDATANAASPRRTTRGRA
jgi:YidC/Oxa1 family membrane protein insertase